MSKQIVTVRTARPRRRNRKAVVVLSGKARRSRKGKTRRRSRVPKNRFAMGAVGGQYLRSLLQPERYSARIPDANGWNTTVFQQVNDITFTTGASGNLAGCFYPVPITPTETNQYAMIFGTAPEGGAQGAWTANVTTASPINNATIVNAMSMYRPVSGCLLLEFIGTTSNDSGQIVACPVFRGELIPKTTAACLQNAYSVAAPLRNGLRFLWKPMDEVDLQFIPCVSIDVPGLQVPGGLVAPTGQPYPSFVGNTGAAGSEPTQTSTALCFFVSGGQASSTILRARWIMNYEATPETSGLQLFQVEARTSNPIEMSTAMNVISKVPWGDVWQGVAGIGGAMLEQAVGTQLPNYLGGLAANGMTSFARGLIGSARGASTPRLSYDYSVD